MVLRPDRSTVVKGGGKLILLALGEADYGLEPGRPGRLPARSSQLPILNENYT